MKRVLVTGSKGQLGTEIKNQAKDYPGFSFIYTDVDELDLTDKDAVNRFFSEHPFDFCINCAAYTAVDKAEDDRQLSRLINVTAVDYLATACATAGTFLVHISTDYVFDGKNHKPYTETDATAPQSFYGLTKLEGEEVVKKQMTDALIIRTSWLYSAYGNNFVKTMLRLGNEREMLGVVSDQVGTPTHAGDLAKAILDILSAGKPLQGVEIYHYSNEGVISWYDFAKAVMSESGLSCKINPIESKDFPTKAKRPFYSVLSKTKIKETFGLEIPYWLDSLKKVLKQLNRQ
jgi:dTDP-4-dehydrorhamnose reductase